ncbi:MAG: hypothetical protein A2932_00330 [Candidatus Spechtbacteria bacterium RIFCSPLOWO2_01_FULL_46_10]|uniref:NodB homology domain-containing protein n=1 Tax=Candidatus Spechtbacteria bacterium RIFCSPLOWO2_01_FULL_46_10 TaxID=1802163 RepID=A0A1G2HJ35_9BACT|nr:MAG: hypothetical protein A2932_00330 [Candidatus Spechtbacteria bacterium RIFCSPLOWO2_01_FULL_46_10]
MKKKLFLGLLVSVFVGGFFAFFAVRTAYSAEAPKLCYDPTHIAVPVLMYHYISPAEAMEYWTTSLSEFKQQMKWFHDNGFSAITVDELYTFIMTGRISNPRSFVPIFDDNWYVSVKNRVLPVMRQYGFTATLALYTDGIYQTGDNVFTWSELRAWERAGWVDVQSHSATHPLSPALNQLSRQNMWREVFYSKILIDFYLHKSVTGFITPGGSVNSSVLLLAKLAGYKTFYLLWENDGVRYQNDPMYIFRVNMVNTLTFGAFIARMERYATPFDLPQRCSSS